MPVSKEITRLEQSNVRLTLTIPKEDLASDYRKFLADFAKTAHIPGFRKGKAPPAVLEGKFGKALKDEALGKILEEAIEGVFGGDSLAADEKPLHYSQPRMEGEPALDLESDLSISLVYDVRPKVALGQWKGLEAEIPEVEVTDEDLARELEAVRDRNSFVIDRDDDAQARDGDIATISYRELGEDGEPVADSGRDDMAYTVGSGKSEYKYDGEIVGMKKGETKDFEKSFPEAAEGDADASPLAGQTVRLRLTLSALKEKKMPDLDDELAQDVDEKFATLDDLKNSIRDRLRESLEERLQQEKITRLLDKVLETTPVALPESMVRAEIGGRIGALGRNFGMSQEAVMRMFGAGGADLEANMRGAAEKALRASLVVDEIARERGVEATDEEAREEIRKMLGAADEADQEELRRREDENLDFARENIRIRKTHELLLAENAIKTGARASYLDFMANNG